MVEEQGNGIAYRGLEGVFSTITTSVIGTGTTRRKQETTMLYFAEEVNPGTVEYRMLNLKFVPFGQATVTDLETFVKEFKPEPEIYETKTLPALRELTKTLAKAERCRSRGEKYSAEYEFRNALKIDEDNARGNFGLGLSLLDQGKNDEATKVLRKLVQLHDTFSSENKHVFNELGIQLRKNKLYDQALSYYASALKVSKEDENLYYNIARTLWDKEDFENSNKYISRAMLINPDFKEGRKLQLAVEKKLGIDRKKAAEEQPSEESAEASAEPPRKRSVEGFRE